MCETQPTAFAMGYKVRFHKNTPALWVYLSTLLYEKDFLICCWFLLLMWATRSTRKTDRNQDQCNTPSHNDVIWSHAKCWVLAMWWAVCEGGGQPIGDLSYVSGWTITWCIYKARHTAKVLLDWFFVNLISYKQRFGETANFNKKIGTTLQKV